jgi:hypothetical protein
MSKINEYQELEYDLNQDDLIRVNKHILKTIKNTTYKEYKYEYYLNFEKKNINIKSTIGEEFPFNYLDTLIFGYNWYRTLYTNLSIPIIQFHLIPNSDFLKKKIDLNNFNSFLESLFDLKVFEPENNNFPKVFIINNNYNNSLNNYNN